MSLRKIFNKDFYKGITLKKAVGVAILSGGILLGLTDTFRMANGQPSILGADNFATAFAAHSGIVSTGLGLVPDSPLFSSAAKATDEERKRVVVKGFAIESGEAPPEGPKLVDNNKADNGHYGLM